MKFQDQLSKNMQDLSRTALLRTIFQAPNLTIGKIRQDLREEDNGQFLIDIFDNLTIEQLVSSAAAFLSAAKSSSSSRQPPPPSPRCRR